MTTHTLRQLAQIGARLRLTALDEEAARIYAVFPDLRTSHAEAPGNGAPARKKRGPFTAERRAAQSIAMKKAWRKRLAARKDA